MRGRNSFTSSASIYPSFFDERDKILESPHHKRRLGLCGFETLIFMIHFYDLNPISLHPRNLLSRSVKLIRKKVLENKIKFGEEEEDGQRKGAMIA